MFYTKQEKEGFYLWNDKTSGKFGPFEGVFCKNIEYGKILYTLELEKFPAYKFALGFTKKRVFVLEENGNLEILTFKK